MSITIDGQTRFELGESVIITEVGGEAVLLDSHSGQYYGLNRIGNQILQTIESKTSLQAVCERLKTQYPDSADDIENDIKELLDDLLEHKLIVVKT